MLSETYTLCFSLSFTSFHSLVNSLPDTIQTVLDEVKESSNFNVFLIAGGPSTVGTSSFHIFQ